MKRLIVAMMITLAACGGGSAPTTVDLSPADEAWWCESIAEAQSFGWDPAQYAQELGTALTNAATNAPTTNLAEAEKHLRSVSCESDYAEDAADNLR